MKHGQVNFPTALAAVIALLIGLTGCKDDSSSSSSSTSTTKTTTTVYASGASAPQAGSSGVVVETSGRITTSATGLTSFSTTIPSGVVSMGIILLGSDTNFKFVEHLNILGTGLSGNITGPNGSSVPLSFNMGDLKNGVSDGVYDTPTGDNLLNLEAAALLFPNDGSSSPLTAGTYTFPIGSANSSTGDLNVDTIQPYVLYKTSAGTGQTMNVNLFVVSGVRSGITSAALAEADAEISGAIVVLRNVYQYNTFLFLNLNINVSIVADSSYISINTSAEQDTLLKSFPSGLPSNALNLYIVGSLSYLPSGVIGLSAGIPGPFNLHGTVVSGTLAEYQGDSTGTILGFTLAHEFGHFLGLWHTSQTNSSGSVISFQDPISDTNSCTTTLYTSTSPASLDNCSDRSNLMFPIVSTNIDPPITMGQAQVILNNPAIYP